MKNTAYCLQDIDDFPQIEVENEGNDEEGYQEYGGVPGLWLVGRAVEDNQTG